MNAQYLIARFLPDLERQETRNIGVIVWAGGSVAYRFLEASDADFVEDHDNYWRWVEYWQELCGQQRLQLYNDPVVTKRTPRFLKALQKTRRGNFRLDFGGEIVDEVTASSAQEAATFLFERIVATPRQAPNERMPTLADKCVLFLREIGIETRVDFKPRFPITLHFQGFQQQIHFDYGIGNGRPESLFNRVNLAREDSVTLAAGKCDITISRARLSKDLLFSLYDSESDGDATDSTIQFLGTFSVPVDIANPSGVPVPLRQLAR